MFGSLRARMILMLIGMSVVPIIAIALVTERQSYAVLERQAVVLQSRVVANVSSEILAFVQERQYELEMLDRVHSLGLLDAVAQETVLQNLLFSQRAFQELTLVDLDGQEQIRLSRIDVVLPGALRSRSNDLAFLVPKQSERSYLGPVVFSERLREPLMTMSVPLVDRRLGEATGVLIAELRFKPVWDLLAGMELPSEGDAYVVNPEGRVVAHGSPDIILSGRAIALPIENGRGTGLAGTSVILAVEQLEIGEQRLSVVAEQPISAALALARLNARFILLVAGLSAVAAILLAIIAAHYSLRPVGRLVSATRAMERGDYSARVIVVRPDEFKELAMAFNAMALHIQTLVTSLQEEVVERRQAEAALREVNERLGELNRLKSKLIADMSHELRTPISNLRLYLDLLTRSTPDKWNRYLGVLDEECDRLVGMTNSIVSISDLQQTTGEELRETVDLSAIVSGVVAVQQPLAQERNLSLSFSRAREELLVQGSAYQLEQVVVHLLRNAIEYTPAGEIRVSTDRAQDCNSARLIVADTGIGLDEEDLDHCFDRFFRGKRVGQYNISPGIGLGLAIVEQIVTQHEGRIHIESRVDQGSTFTVYLPLAGNPGANSPEAVLARQVPDQPQHQHATEQGAGTPGQLAVPPVEEQVGDVSE